MTEQRYVLGVAYAPGPDPLIKRGADGFIDTVDPDDLELAAWQFMKGDRRIGLNHSGDDFGHAEVVESYVWRGPAWELPDGQIVKSGTWMLGAIVDEPTWALIKSGQITGWSFEGSGRRVKES